MIEVEAVRQSESISQIRSSRKGVEILCGR